MLSVKNSRGLAGDIKFTDRRHATLERSFAYRCHKLQLVFQLCLVLSYFVTYFYVPTSTIVSLVELAAALDHLFLLARIVLHKIRSTLFQTNIFAVLKLKYRMHAGPRIQAGA